MSKVALSGNALGSGTFTIASPNSNVDRTLNLPDASGTILTTATPGVPVNGPAFSAYKSPNNQAVSSGTWTKVTFTSEAFDTNNNYDSNGRFTPTVAGYYQVNWGVGGETSSGIARLLSAIWKNGGEYTRSTDLSTLFGVTGSSLVYMNGSTDYIEIYTYISATTPVVAAGSSLTFFQAFLARSAT